ncbi:hypothetical protein GGR50DRAFT_696864 [Xylaria sp. CBS 124048]|nr:hypothetical protein GGR50DRAFT_696864 [Xylaria sp. CBS 124048]
MSESMPPAAYGKCSGLLWALQLCIGDASCAHQLSCRALRADELEYSSGDCPSKEMTSSECYCKIPIGPRWQVLECQEEEGPASSGILIPSVSWLVIDLPAFTHNKDNREDTNISSTRSKKAILT